MTEKTFVGLTQLASQFCKQMEITESHEENGIKLISFVHPKYGLMTEEIQETDHYIFTHLRLASGIPFFKWHRNPNLKDDYDEYKGEYK